MPDDRFIGALAREQAQRAEQNAFARAGFARDRSKPRFEVERPFFEQREIADPESLQHARDEGTKTRQLSSGV